MRSSFAFTIHRACKSWESFHESLNKAEELSERNQYPPGFYDSIVSSTIQKIVTSDNDNKTEYQSTTES